MNFCPKCQFMLYTRLTELKTLQHYCKNCEWFGSDYFDDKESVCVYSKDYSNKFIALKTLTNKYTLHDPTLPRVNNIECVNLKCLTNLNDIDIGKTIHLSNIGIINSEKSILFDFLSSEPFNITQDKYTLIDVNTDELLITFDLEEDFNKLSIKNHIEISETKINVKKYQKPDREIIFMKYDNKNLKFLYMCSTCRTTWKTE